MLRFTTAGESHGRCLIALVEGLPHGLRIDEDYINTELARRQCGYGRGGRMKIETDTVEVLTGVRRGITIGGPLALRIANRDFRIDDAPAVTQPRPGHGDLAGMLKYGLSDARDILERASARETAARVAAGAIASLLLREVGVEVIGYVRGIGPVQIDPVELGPDALRAARDASETCCPDQAATDAMKAAIDAARNDGDTLGGLIEAVAFGVPAGLGSHVQWRSKLDGRLARAVMSIQAMKSVEIGMGCDVARARGSEVHDEILPGDAGPQRPTNRAGGIEAGMTNGCPVVVRAAMKPIPTLMRPLRTVDVTTGAPADASTERSDVCAVPAASVVVQHAVAFELAAAAMERFGGDTTAELKTRSGRS